MNLKIYLKNLEKIKIITRKPHPILPFILTILIFILYRVSLILNNELFSTAILTLLIFTLIFAILHLIVYKILTSKQK